MDDLYRITLRILVYIVVIIRVNISNILLQPVTYYKRMKGKNTRSILSEYIGRIYKIPPEYILFIKRICNDCHNASLVIDDIQDNSECRRGQPSAHIVYGIPFALNAGYLSAFKILHTLPYELKERFQENQYTQSEEFRENMLVCATKSIYYMHIGQGLDIYWSTYKITPSMHEYFDMVEKKTGVLFTSVNEFCSIIQPNSISKLETQNIHHGLKLLSYFFQIRDDYINITDPDVWKQKTICEDFDESKQTYMIVLFYHDSRIPKGVKNEFFSLFYQTNKSKRNKLRLLRILHENEVLSRTYKYLLSTIEELKTTLRIPFLYKLLKVNNYQVRDLEKYMIQ